MLSFEGISFYNDYFQGLDDFKLEKPFKEARLEVGVEYLGQIRAVDTVHPLLIDVHIPIRFPYEKLSFTTLSLAGYPHLISHRDAKKGSWFCLNAPFAESTVAQLDAELDRLRVWINHYMNADLPPIITDFNVTRALAIANAYNWENVNDRQGLQEKAKFVIVGDFAQEASFIEKGQGYFWCLKGDDERLFAVNNSGYDGLVKIPYIIVDELPDNCGDYIALAKQLHWDDNVRKFLLPELSVLQQSYYQVSREYTDMAESEEQALAIMKTMQEELEKEVPCIEKSGEKVFIHDPALKAMLLDNVKDLTQGIQTKKVFSYKSWVQHCETQDREASQFDFETYYETPMYFVLGVRMGDAITWVIFQTFHGKEICESSPIKWDWDHDKYRLGIAKVCIHKLVGYGLSSGIAQQISTQDFYGRGQFCESLRNRKIALIGLGAIGSMVAESLTKSGAQLKGLWDEQIVDPGNICRSAFTMMDVGEGKPQAIKKMIMRNNPFFNIGEIDAKGNYTYRFEWIFSYENGSFYESINYKSQEEALKELEPYDLFIDCTGSNEMLHFLSHNIPADKEVISLCITNHATHLLCMTNHHGNPYELRKAFLSRIEQDTQNMYVEGTGCYNPTFLAKYSDIASLVNLFVRSLDQALSKEHLLDDSIWAYTDRGIVQERLLVYRLIGGDIQLFVGNETLLDGEDLPDTKDAAIGFLLGSYSKDGKAIMLTHFVAAQDAENRLINAYASSKGIIDYIGDFSYSGPEMGTFHPDSLALLSEKAAHPGVNTNNPLLAVRNPDGSIDFFLFMNGGLVAFERCTD